MLSLILANGGWILVPIALTSVAMVSVTVERACRLIPLRRRMEDDRLAVIDVLATGGSTLSGGSPAVRIATAMLKASPKNRREAGLDAAQQEVIACERGLGVLLAASQVAPLFGLLGTVVGLIEAFQGASAAATISASVLSGGIYKALTTTVAGLIVAIPAYLLYVGFSAMVARIAQHLERTVKDIVTVVDRP